MNYINYEQGVALVEDLSCVPEGWVQLTLELIDKYETYRNT